MSGEVWLWPDTSPGKHHPSEARVKGRGSAVEKVFAGKESMLGMSAADKFRWQFDGKKA